MKLSTRIKRYVPACDAVGTSSYGYYDYTYRMIVLIVDGGRNPRFPERLETYSLEMADVYHHHLTRDEKCMILPPNECPVVNRDEIVIHYSSGSYADWCNGIIR